MEKIPVAGIDNFVGSSKYFFFLWSKRGFPPKDPAILLLDFDLTRWGCFAANLDFRILGDGELVDHDEFVCYRVQIGDLVLTLAIEGRGLVDETGCPFGSAQDL